MFCRNKRRFTTRPNRVRLRLCTSVPIQVRISFNWLACRKWLGVIAPTCRIFRGATIQPNMSNNPVEKLAYQSHLFANTGVNYQRPILRHSSLIYREEVGIPLHLFDFFCAVHVNIIASMNTNSYAVALGHYSGTTCRGSLPLAVEQPAC